MSTQLMELLIDDEDTADSERALKQGCEVLFEALMISHALIKERYTSNAAEIQALCQESSRQLREDVLATMQGRFSETFATWFNGAARGQQLRGCLGKYVSKCLNVCIGMEHFSLSFYPATFARNDGDQLEIVDLLDYQDVMQREGMFDCTPKHDVWYCSFPAVVKNQQGLDAVQIREILNKKETGKYGMFRSKMSMFQSE